MTAPESVVAAVMRELGCGAASYKCRAHPEAPWDLRGCPEAVEAADAAWAAAYPAALRDAAEKSRFTDEESENAIEATQEGEWTWFQWLFRERLLRWADESEA